MSEEPKLNKHGFPVPEVQIMAKRDISGSYTPTAYTPAGGQEPMTPLQQVASTGVHTIVESSWDKDGNPLTEAAKEQLRLVNDTV